MNKIRIIATTFVAVMLVGCASGGMNDTAPTVNTGPAVTSKAPAKAASKPAATTTAKPISAEQRNAARSAQSYLSGETGFSRKGLIGQLKYEGYSVKAATAAVDSLGIDWNAQAALKARGYLDGQAFSRKGLIGQLKYEGFTAQQATYGVKQAGL